MGINNAKHIIGEIDGIRCTIVDTGATIERAAFLHQLLEFNNFEVKELKVVPGPEGGEPQYTIGVTDIVFNPVFAVYDNSLKTPEGGHVTPGYWLQECTECDRMYWMRKKPVKTGQ
ncbi:MAG: hypothetical protein WCE64_07800 [Bacteroidales bacterium]